jgi:hypothetical protein
MANIASYAELQFVIRMLETERDVKLKLVKKQFYLINEGLNPVKRIKRRLKEFTASPYLNNIILNIVVGVATGFLSKKAITGRSNSKLRRFLGIVLQFGITSLLAQRTFHKEK